MTEAAATDDEASFDPVLLALMDGIGQVLDGQSSGVAIVALMNCLHHAAEGATAEHRALLLESIPEIIGAVEAMDAPKH